MKDILMQDLYLLYLGQRTMILKVSSTTHWKSLILSIRRRKKTSILR